MVPLTPGTGRLGADARPAAITRCGTPACRGLCHGSHPATRSTELRKGCAPATGRDARHTEYERLCNGVGGAYPRPADTPVWTLMGRIACPRVDHVSRKGCVGPILSRYVSRISRDRRVPHGNPARPHAPAQPPQLKIG